MAKDLPYYKHFPGEWITGDITLCSMTTQGVFVNLCNYYWNRSCCMSYANAVQRFTEHKKSVDELIEKGIIKTSDNENEKIIIIEFLDEQMQEFENISEKRREAANKRYSTNAVQEQCKSSAKPHNKEKRREEKRKVENYTVNDFSFLGDERFSGLWNDYLKSRKTKLNVIGQKASLKKLHKYTLDISCKALEKSIESGYTGLFPESIKPNKPTPTRPSIVMDKIYT